MSQKVNYSQNFWCWRYFCSKTDSKSRIFSVISRDNAEKYGFFCVFYALSPRIQGKWHLKVFGVPNGTNVFKSGPLTKTTIFTVFRGRLRRRNQTKGNLPLAFQFVCSPGRGGAANKLKGKWKVRSTKNHQNRRLCRMSWLGEAVGGWKSRLEWESTFIPYETMPPSDIRHLRWLPPFNILTNWITILWHQVLQY